jgi:excisionase family DNA binding protein
MTEPPQVGFGLDELAEVIRGKLFMTVPEVADLTRVDQRTLRRAIEDGQLAAVRIGSAVRIPTAAFLQLARLLEPDDNGTDSTEFDFGNSEAAPASTATRSDLRHLKAIRHGNFDPPTG